MVVVANILLVVIKKPLMEISADEINDTSIILNALVLKDNGYDINELYIKMNDEIKPIVNNKVSFLNLEKEQEYNYEVLYKKDNEYISVFIKNKIKTALVSPSINSIQIKYSGNDLIFSTNLTDIDNTIKGGTIKIGDLESPIIDGIANFRNFKGNTLDNLEVVLIIDTKNGKGEVNKVFLDYKVYLNTDILIDLGTGNFNNILEEIYK